MILTKAEKSTMNILENFSNACLELIAYVLTRKFVSSAYSVSRTFYNKIVL